MTPTCIACGILLPDNADGDVCPKCAAPVDPGSLGWAFRPPEKIGREGCDLEIEMRDGTTPSGVRVMYQQPPPVHVKGSGYRSAAVRTVPAEISEAKAKQRIADLDGKADVLPAAVARVMRLRLAGLKAAAIAERLKTPIGTVYSYLKRGKARIA